MDDDLNFETYLYISKKKLIICVNSETNKKIYKKEIIYNQSSEEITLDKVDIFLNENILKIEKILKDFIKKIIVILDFEDFFTLDVSIKKDNYENVLSLKTLNHILFELRDHCKETIVGKKIIHMIIENYLIDEKNFNFFPKNKKCNNFSLDVKFICLSEDFIRDIELILKKYQISLKQVVNADYVNEFINDDENDIFLMTRKIINGYNKNEVQLINKIQQNEGFFEKFFKFFS